MQHILAKTILISRVSELIAKEYSMSIHDARDAFYNSKVIDILDDDDSGLYGESPLYIFSLFERYKK